MHILLADDHALVRETFGRFLMGSPMHATVTEAGSLSDVIDAANQGRCPDLILLDLVMPGMNGIAGILEVAEKFPGTPVVIVSGSTRRDDIHGAIKLGAKGFIPKTMRPREFVEAIDIVMSGGTFIPQIDSAGGTVTRATPQTTAVSSAMQDTALKSLTPREREVLGHLIKGLPNKKIADEMALQEITIRVHLQNVYRKLGVSNRAHAVATALNGGWSDLCVA